MCGQNLWNSGAWCVLCGVSVCNIGTPQLSVQLTRPWFTCRYLSLRSARILSTYVVTLSPSHQPDFSLQTSMLLLRLTEWRYLIKNFRLLVSSTDRQDDLIISRHPRAGCQPHPRPPIQEWEADLWQEQRGGLGHRGSCAWLHCCYSGVHCEQRVWQVYNRNCHHVIMLLSCYYHAIKLLISCNYLLITVIIVV